MIKLLKYVLIILALYIFPTFPQEIKYSNQLRLAKLFESQGQISEAEEIYKELHSKQPKNFQIYSALNKNLITQKKYEQAVNLINNQIKITKKNVILLGDLGSVYFLLGNEEKANEIWEQAVEIDPNNVFAYRTIANFLIDFRLIDSAIDFLKRGNEVSNDNTIFSYDIAHYYSITMKFEEATREYCKILKSKPKQINLIKNRISVYINSEQATEPTIEAIEEIYEEEDRIFYLQLLSDLYFVIGNYEKALETKTIIEEKTTNNGSGLFAFAQQCEYRSNYKTAAKAFKEIIDKYPNSALVSEAEIGYTKTSEANMKIKSTSKEEWKPFNIKKNNNKAEFQNLLLSYKNILRKYPNTKVGKEAEFRIAKIYSENLNNLEKADSIFRKITNEPKSVMFVPEAEYELAKILIKTDKLEKAINRLKNVIESKYSKPSLKQDAQFLYAKTLLWKGKFTNSVQEFNKVTENKEEFNVNDALQYSLIINTLKNDSTNLFFFANADYLIEKNNFIEAGEEFYKLASDNNLFLLKDFAAIRYAELQLALNNYEEAGIFLEKKSNCDENNIYKDRFLYLLGSNYYYGLKNEKKALSSLMKILDNFPNSIYFNKARKIISEINVEVNNSI